MAMAMSQRSGPLLLLPQTKPVSFSPSLCSLPPLAVAPQLCRWSRRRKRRMRAFLFMQKDPSPQKPGEEPPETLFMRELKRRGLSSTTDSGKENQKLMNDSQAQVTTPLRKESLGPFDERTQVDQRKQSMALNSEGLEGLIPRAKALISLGGSFFLSFGPLIIASITIFLVLYFYYGPVFIHSGSSVEQRQPIKYVDPYELLEKEQIPPEMGPSLVPFNTR